MRQKILSKDKMIKKIRKSVTKRVFDPSKFRGIYKDLKVSLHGEIIELRKEWTRD
jgi:hypothetical protein